MKRLYVLLIIMSSAISAGAVTAVVGPYLQLPTTSSIRILWRTDAAVNSTVWYGTDPANLNMTENDTAAVTQHNVLLSGLSSYTRYYYAVGSDSGVLEGGTSDYTFRTHPDTNRQVSVKAWVIGDFGKGNSKQAEGRNSFTALPDSRETDVWLWLGDNVYSDGLEQEYLDKVMDSVWGYRNMMHWLPFYPCPGNHDYNVISPVTNPEPPLQHRGPYYEFFEGYKNGEAGGVPTGHELFYSFDYGNVHFMSLNSELGSVLSQSDDWTGVSPIFNFNGSPFTRWMEQDLQANKKPWVVAYIHQPPYTDGSHESTAFWEVYMQAVRENLIPILERYGVDLVLAGHSHVYERSHLVKGLYGDLSDFNPSMILDAGNGIETLDGPYKKYTQGTNANTGTVYVVAGNSGSSETDAGLGHPLMYAGYACDTCCGSFFFEVNGNRLDGKFLTMGGQWIDSFTILKIDGVNQVRSEEQEAFLLRAEPNPAGRDGRIVYEIPSSGKVQLFATDALGRHIELYSAQQQTSGKHSFALSELKRPLDAGHYLLRLMLNGKTVKLSRFVHEW